MDTPARSPSAFVGRMRELAMLHDTFTDAIAGRGKCILLSGEAGIGKTTLAEVFCREAVAQGASLLVGRCYDLTATPPYGPWAELFGRHLAKGSTPAPPPAFTRHGAVGKVESAQILHREVADFLAALAKTCPVVLLLDDMHWADPASLDLLRFIARELSDLRVLCLVTYRGDELGRSHPLATLLPLLVREAGAARIDLGRFSLDTLRALVRARFTLDATDENRLVTYLQSRAEGHTLFTVELLRTLEEHGILHEGERSVGSLASIRVPTLLRRVIDARLARLGEDAVHLLGIAAIIGQEVPLSVWAAVADGDPDLLLAITARAADARLADETPEGDGIRFAHALIREALYEGVRPSERRRWHRQTGEVLAASARPDPDDVAGHFQRAGDARALPWLLQAGERAQATYAWVTAAARFEAALAIMEPNGADATERGWLVLRLASLLRFADKPRARAYIAEALAVGERTGVQSLVAFARYLRGADAVRFGDAADGLRDIEAAIGMRAALSAEERDRYAAQVAGLAVGITHDWREDWLSRLAHQGYLREGQALGEQLLAEVEARGGAGSADDLGPYGLHAIGIIYAALGRPEDAARIFARSHDSARRIGSHVQFTGTLGFELLSLILPYRTENLARRAQLVAQMLTEGELGRGSATPGRFGGPYHYLMPLFLLAGRWDEVEEFVVFATSEEGGHFLARVGGLQHLATLSLLQGDTERAWGAVRRGLPEESETAPGTVVMFGVALALQRVAAILSLDAREMAQASQWLTAHDRWLAWSGAQLGRSEGAALWARYYRQAGDQDQAYAHAERALALASDPRQPLALLAAHRLMGELHTDARRFDAARTHLTESLRLAEACAAPYERALTLLACAALDAAAARSNDARRNLQAVREICESLGAKPALVRAETLLASLAAIDAPAYPAGLSAREVEVLRLLVTGKTNREIAGTLSLSPGTVNIHVTHILSKTESDNRAQAAAFALRHGLA